MTVRKIVARASTGLFVLLAAAPAAVAQPAPAVYATPADVVAACQAATARRDVPTALDCYSPAMQEQIATMLVTMIARTPTTLPAGQVPDPEKTAFEQRHHLADRHQSPGESADAYAARLLSGIPDRRAFLLDFMARQAAHTATRPASTQPAPQFSDVKIDPSGTTATAKLSRPDTGAGGTSQTLKFEKVAGSWRLASLMFF